MFELWYLLAYLLHQPVLVADVYHPMRFNSYEECMVEGKKYVEEYNTKHEGVMEIKDWTCREDI